MRSVVLLGRRGPVSFPLAKLSTNEDGRLTSGDALTKMIKLRTKDKEDVIGVSIGVLAKGKEITGAEEVEGLRGCWLLIHI